MDQKKFYAFLVVAVLLLVLAVVMAMNGRSDLASIFGSAGIFFIAFLLGKSI